MDDIVTRDVVLNIPFTYRINVEHVPEAVNMSDDLFARVAEAALRAGLREFFLPQVNANDFGFVPEDPAAEILLTPVTPL